MWVINPAAILHIIMPIRLSSIRQAIGFLNTGISQRAPQAKPKNHIKEAVTAPNPNHNFSLPRY
jgi:hypothetical protein|tara:strand:+ start:1686 stop:1877 length:192 start_codon:yes stop_codon:yes gene_type:complete